jgi:hypothetical protein
MISLELLVNGEAVVKMEINANLLSQIFQLNASPAGAAEPAKSSPLTKAQAETLLSQVDEKCADFLKRVAANQGVLTWGETKALFHIKDWDAFASGPGKTLARAVRHILHDKSARLVWRTEHEWEGLEKGEDEVCMLHVDGAALQALREATGSGA